MKSVLLCALTCTTYVFIALKLNIKLARYGIKLTDMHKIVVIKLSWTTECFTTLQRTHCIRSQSPCSTFCHWNRNNEKKNVQSTAKISNNYWKCQRLLGKLWSHFRPIKKYRSHPHNTFTFFQFLYACLQANREIGFNSQQLLWATHSLLQITLHQVNFI